MNTRSLAGIEIGKGRGAIVEPVAGDKYKVAAGFHAPSVALLSRHVLRECFIAGQLLDHGMRQVIGLPRSTHGLLGRLDLWSLNPCFLASA